MNKKLSRLIQPSMPLYFIVLFAFALADFFFADRRLAYAEGGLTLLLLVFMLAKRAQRRKELAAYIQSATDSIEAASVARMPFPMVLFRIMDGEIIWRNEQFQAVIGVKESAGEQRIEDIFPGFSSEWLLMGKGECPTDLRLGQRRYRVYGSVIRAEDKEGTLLGALYLSDQTELYQIRDEYIRSRPVVAIILFDNYEEMTKSLTEGAISNLNAELYAVLTTWTERFHGMLRRMERDRFLFVFEAYDLQKAMEDKFSLLEDVHRVLSPSGIAATISMGLGRDGRDFDQTYHFAAQSLDMALSRGGDQAVLKDRLNFSFYGGRTTENNTNSQLLARTSAKSLEKLIEGASQVFVMGHKNADLDVLGAALGICCLCRKKEKTAYIVLDQEHNAAGRLVKQIRQEPKYAGMLISGQDSLVLADRNSVLVVVDTNRPEQVECRPLLEAIRKICIIDHHRKAADSIEPTISCLVPSASSACELTGELLQFTVTKEDILPVEVLGLLSGIALDTKSFSVRTGERTFEVAAILKRLGADTVQVKKLLQSDLPSTVAKHQIIKSAKLYKNQIAIAALDTDCDRTIAAQAADELLDVYGILTSFVLYPHEDQIIISARSIGECNVQVVLESLGGGGNAAAAGAQVKGSDLATVLARLQESIKEYYEK